MSDQALAVVSIEQQIDSVLEATLNSVGRGSRRAYQVAIRAYFDWASRQPQPDPYSSLLAYRKALEDSNLQSATINRDLSALRAFFRSAFNMGLIDQLLYSRVREIKNIPSRGNKKGHWLSLEEARSLLNAPDQETWIGRRDRAILAVMIGCGLRRSEVANLRWDHLQQLPDGTWEIVNLVGKHNRVRTVPVQKWVSGYISHFTEINVRLYLGANSNQVFVSIDRYGNRHTTISTNAIWNIVQQYAAQVGINKLAPHDLRRTFANLIRDGGGELEEVQQLLGHASIATTQKYLDRGLNAERVSGLIKMEA